MKTPQGRELRKQASGLPTLIDKLDATIAATAASMARLQRAGLIYAKPHWREGKYLYLIYPSQDGQRERRYIGTHPGKIEEAQAGIRRAAEYDRLAAQLKRQERLALICGSKLTEALTALEA